MSGKQPDKKADTVAKAPEMAVKEAAGQYLHWKHATFGKKPEDTKEDVEYKLRLNHLVDQHA